MTKKFKICKYIPDALYVAPNEIRACCQRFFYKNEIRGDAKLIDIVDGVTPTVSDLKNARQKIFNEIQLNKKKDCLGCNFLYEVDKKPDFDGKVNFLSIEHHSVCNLRCTYCSEVYYAGKRSKYDVYQFIEYLDQKNSFKDCKQVVWGGGEPTLDRTFEQIVKKIDKTVSPDVYHRVYTNAVRYHKAVKEFIDTGLIKITTSIDAGTPETFLKVRGRPKFFNVFENLKIYSNKIPNHVTIKYIMTDTNSNEDELNAFVNRCLEYNLEECCYQISMDFKDEKISNEQLKNISYLFGILVKKGINKVFVDYHILQRLTLLSENDLEIIKKYLISKNLEEILIYKSKNIILYGSGFIANEMINKSNFFKNLDDYDIVDTDKERIGKMINGKKIKSPYIIKEDDRDIVIASAQAYDDILSSIISIKGNSKNIITKLII